MYYSYNCYNHEITLNHHICIYIYLLVTSPFSHGVPIAEMSLESQPMDPEALAGHLYSAPRVCLSWQSLARH